MLPDSLRRRAYRLKTAAFSDSFVLACPFSRASGRFGQFYEFFRLVGWAQFRLATQGIFIRGAIALGDLHMRGPLLFGPAIEEAYTLESNEARMPVVVVSQNVRAAYGAFEKSDGAVGVAFWRDFLWVFFGEDGVSPSINGMPFTINYLGVARYEDITTGDFDYLLRDHQRGVEGWLKEFRDEKSLFVAKYHNHVAERFFPERQDLLITFDDVPRA
jgi:hypothetical protein